MLIRLVVVMVLSGLNADGGAPDAGAQTPEQCFVERVQGCRKLPSGPLQVACVKAAHRECRYMPEHG